LAAQIAPSPPRGTIAIMCLPTKHHCSVVVLLFVSISALTMTCHFTPAANSCRDPFDQR